MVRHLRLLAALAALTAFAGPAWADDGKPPPPDKPAERPASEDQPDDEYVVEDSPHAELEIACVQEQDADACLAAGLAWFEGRDLDKPNVTQAVNLWTAGCSFGSGEACLRAGQQYLVARVGVVFYGRKLSADFGEADRLLALGCGEGTLEACGLRGDLNANPKAMLPEGGPTLYHGLSQSDLLLSAQCYESGCPLQGDADLRSCIRLGQMFAAGQGGRRRDVDMALRYWERACELSGGSGEPCDEAAALREAQPEPSDPEPRVSVQPHRPTPNVRRFEDPAVGIADRAKGEHWVRFDFELGVGARWIYGPNALGGIKLRAGMNLWFNVVGIALESGFHTDKLVAVQIRRYVRYQHALAVKLAIPMPWALPYNARMHVVFGAGGTVGSLKLPPAGFVAAYGFRELFQLVLSTNQQRGPRQWGALRVEQQQTWRNGGGATVEHSTQVMLIAGFTFGGRGPDWRPKTHADEQPDLR